MANDSRSGASCEIITIPCRVLSQFGALLGFIIDDEHASLNIQAAFVDQMQIAISGMAAWKDLETLVYDTCDVYPVRLRALYTI